MRRALVLALATALIACSSKSPDKKFFDEVGSLPKEEIMARGDALAAKKKPTEARRYYSFLADSFPNDPLGRQAALKVADTFYQAKDTESLTEARLRYKDFANRFPNDPGRPYALLMLGKCSYQQARGPLRDLTPIREAVDSFKQVVDQFPSSQYTAEARELLTKSVEELAEHELLVARYYVSISAWVGARLRLEYLIATYPDTDAAHAGKDLLASLDNRGIVPATPSPSATPTPSFSPFEHR